VANTSHPRVRFVSAIVADDISRDANGKETITGVYASCIILRSVNRNNWLKIGISLMLETHGIGDVPIRLRVIGPSGVSVGINAVIHSQETTGAGQINTLSLTGLQLPMQREGKLVIEARQYEEDWQLIRMLPVIIKPNKSASLEAIMLI
jgi:hypothetical protein